MLMWSCWAPAIASLFGQTCCSTEAGSFCKRYGDGLAAPVPVSERVRDTSHTASQHPANLGHYNEDDRKNCRDGSLPSLPFRVTS